MKNIRLIVAVLFILAGKAATAQDFSSEEFAKWGATSEQREQNMFNSNLLKEAIDSRDYQAATKYFNILVTEAPAASENTFIRGATLYANKINMAAPADKQALIDTLMQVYDMRIKYFPDSPRFGKAYLLNRKACEYRAYNPSDIKTLLVLFKEAINAEESQGREFMPEAAMIYFNILAENYKAGNVPAEEVFNEYARLIPIYNDPSTEAYKTKLDSNFITSGVANCESLEQLFSKRIDNDPSEQTLTQAFILMTNAKCDSEFYMDLVEDYYEINPTAEKAMQLAEIFQNRTEYAKASKYLREALATENTPEKRAQLLIRVGLLDLSANRISAAAAAAREACSIDPNSGIAYFILAQCYAISASGCQGISAGGAMWAAYDTMSKAADLLGNTTEHAVYSKSARELMIEYRRHFPSTEECFFNELKEGSRYTVTCGAAAGIVTTVRPK